MGLELINKLKQEKGITSDELANTSGVPIGTLNKILNGQTKNPSLETVFALAHALGCSVDDLDDGNVEERPLIDLSEQEKNLIEIWRGLSVENKYKLMGMAELKLSEQK